MFAFAPVLNEIVDDVTGDVLRSLEYHPHADSRTDGIFAADGELKYSVRFWSRSIDHTPTLNFPDDGISRLVLLSAVAFDAARRPIMIDGEHEILTRIVEFYERSSRSKTNFVKFEFIDLRHKRM